MIRFHTWPPPKEWITVLVPWAWTREKPNYDLDIILSWLDQTPGGRYHLHGLEDFKRYPKHGIGIQGLQDFEFRFEQEKDAVLFKLKWEI